MAEAAPAELPARAAPAGEPPEASPGLRVPAPGHRTGLAALGAIFLLALLARAALALTLPPWLGPDEPKHFEYVRLLVDLRGRLWAERRLLDLRDADPALQTQIIASLARHHFWEHLGQTTPNPLPANFRELWRGAATQLHRPSLYYLVAAPAVLPLLGRSLEAQLAGVRLVSALLSALAVPVTYLAAREAVPDDRFVPLAAAGLVAALPMHVFIGATANNDNLATVAGSAVALALARGLRRGFGVRGWAVALGLLALALATKRTTAALVPAAVLAGGLALAALRGRRLALALGGLGLGLGAGALALVFAAQTRLLGPLLASLGRYALNEPDQLLRVLRAPLDAPEVQRLIPWHLGWLLRSFWGVFGWFSLPLRPELYRLLTTLTVVLLLSFLGWLSVGAVRQLRRPTPARGAQLAVLLVYLVAVLALVALAIGERLAYFSPNEIPQGRYLFVVVAPLATIFALGARALLPRRYLGTWGPLALWLGALLAFDAVVYTQHLGPAYLWRVFG